MDTPKIRSLCRRGFCQFVIDPAFFTRLVYQGV